MVEIANFRLELHLKLQCERDKYMRVSKCCIRMALPSVERQPMCQEPCASLQDYQDFLPDDSYVITIAVQ